MRSSKLAPLITVEELDKAQTFLNSKTGDRCCSICNHQKRTLHPNIFSFPDFPLRTTVTGVVDTQAAVFMDLMFTTCNNCGHVDFFNAHQLGVMIKGKKVL